MYAIGFHPAPTLYKTPYQLLLLLHDTIKHSLLAFATLVNTTHAVAHRVAHEKRHPVGHPVLFCYLLLL